MLDFKNYDNKNPQIWEKFKELAIEAKYQKHFQHYSSKGIFELIRWHTGISANRDKLK